MRRLSNLFSSDGKIVIAAIDHGLALDVLPAMNDTGGLIGKLEEGGADAVLVTYGTAQRFEKEIGNMKMIVRVDGGTTKMTMNPSGNFLYSVEDAVKIGADAVVCMGFPGGSNEKISLQTMASYASQAREWGVPLMAEMLPAGFEGTYDFDEENIKFCSRVGAEHGVHIIKTAFTGSVEGFRKVVEGSFSPVVVLGGAQSSNLMGLLKEIEMAIEAGAAGVAIGRNIWSHPHPECITRAIAEIVHEGKSAEEVSKLIK